MIPRSMVTGKLRRFEGVRRLRREPSAEILSALARRIQPPLMLVWRLAGWFARSLPRRLRVFRMVSPGGCIGTRTAIWRHKNLLRVYLIDTKLIGLYKACKKNVRE